MKAEPLRVCLLSQLYPPGDVEGVARLTHLMAQGLAELGHEVHVIRRGQSERTAYYDGAYVHDIPVSDWRYQAIKAAGYPLVNWCVNYSHAVYDRVCALMANHRIQVVDSPLWQFEGLVTAVAKAVPVVVRLVTSMRQLVALEGYASLETTLIGDLEASFLRLCQGLIPLSQAIQNTCAELYGIDFTNYPHRVIHAGLKPLPEAAVSPLDGRAEAEPVVLFVGRLEKRKGILNLFEAIPKVLARFPKAQFWLVGKDNSQYDGFAEQKRMTYAEYFHKAYRACTDQVRFMGYVSDEELGQLYDRCDLLVAPSLFESFGLVFLEAMNHARPAIGCAVGGPTEIVADGETGMLVPPDAPAALAEAIIQLLADAEARRAMGLAGRRRLLERFHYVDMARNYAEFYRSLAAG
jgi:glycogen(starch) synthase